jgi:hypothetical protein
MSQDIAPSALGAQFGIGKALGTSLAILGRNFIPFTVIAIVVQLPILLAQLYLDPNFNPSATAPVAPDMAGTFTYLGIIMLISAVVNGLTLAALIYGSFQDLRGQKVGLAECFARALAVLPIVIVASLAFALLLGLGMALLIVPGIIFYVVFWLYAAAIVVEKKGISAAFTRSRELTQGKRWHIFAIVLILFVIIFGVDFLLGVILGATLGADAAVPIAVGVYLINSVIGAYMAVTIAVTYYYLRADKEGVDIEDIAKLFD